MASLYHAGVLCCRLNSHLLRRVAQANCYSLHTFRIWVLYLLQPLPNRPYLGASLPIVVVYDNQATWFCLKIEIV